MLTKREIEVLSLFCYNYAEIAKILSISPHTSKIHIHNILVKLKEPTKIRALIKALKLGIINIFSLDMDYKDVGFWDEKGKYKVKMEKITNENI